MRFYLLFALICFRGFICSDFSFSGVLVGARACNTITVGYGEL